MSQADQSWVPDACTLPTAAVPLRVSEFGDLFATALPRQERVSPTRLRWRIPSAAERSARDLAAREASCCSFFTFTFTPAGEEVQVEVVVPPERVEVIDALSEHAAAQLRQGSDRERGPGR